MKVESLLFWIGAVFYAIVTTVYYLLAHELAGAVALTLTGLMTLLIAGYLQVTGSRVGVRPEDRFDADIDEADPDYGFFSPYSWWPLPVGFFASMIGIGFVFARWIVVLAVMGLMFSLVGFVFEYYRGDHADLA
jgi:hypothetical protein